MGTRGPTLRRRVRRRHHAGRKSAARCRRRGHPYATTGRRHRTGIHRGRRHVPLPEGPPFFRFAAADQSRQILERAGFVDVEVRVLPLTWRLDSPDGVYDALSRGGVRTAAVLRAQTPKALDAIRGAVRRSVERYKEGDRFVVPMPAVLASATKPWQP